jgi:hypothetical protein
VVFQNNGEFSVRNEYKRFITDWLPVIFNAIKCAVGVGDISMLTTPKEIWREIQEQRA